MNIVISSTDAKNLVSGLISFLHESGEIKRCSYSEKEALEVVSRLIHRDEVCRLYLAKCIENYLVIDGANFMVQAPFVWVGNLINWTKEYVKSNDIKVPIYTPVKVVLTTMVYGEMDPFRVAAEQHQARLNIMNDNQDITKFSTLEDRNLSGRIDHIAIDGDYYSDNNKVVIDWEEFARNQ